MLALNLWAAWIGIGLGLITGVGQGLRFHRDDWMGGYASWRRRLIRLGHISFFGLALINLAFVFTVDRMAALADAAWSPTIVLASYLFVAGALLMPAICYLSAWRQGWRRLFFLPVGCLLIAVLSLLIGGLS